MREERELALVADPDGARSATLAVREMLADVDGFVVNACELAVAEACANVVEHAYAGAGGPLRVVLRVRPGRFSAAVCDRGRPFDAASGSASFPHPSAEGGRGLMLLRICMDRLVRRRVEGENRLLMCRTLPGDP